MKFHTLILLKTWCAIIILNLVCQLSQYWFTAYVCNNYLFIFFMLAHLPNFLCCFFWHIKYVGLQNLIQRNEQLYGSGNTPSGGVDLPFILVQVNMSTSMFCCLLYILDRMKVNSTSAHGLELNPGYLFFCLQTRPHATVEVEISEDMQLVHFDFNR